MRYSQMLIPTLRESPGEAEIISHCLMLRAGLIRKVAAGVYNFLPMGWRVMKKIIHIIREEMDKVGAQEVFLPALNPAELWEETGRWKIYGPELMRIKDRHDRRFCLGPTHEEIITDLVRREIRSYRQLPITLYQIQTKFRDEIRPRFGIMRAREFMMQDAYSFHHDEHSANQSYKDMYICYERIFKRCGLEFKVVEADSGAIGGKFSHEFMVIADSGEDAIVSCFNCNYASNLEKAECTEIKNNGDTIKTKGNNTFEKLEMIKTPGRTTVEEVCEFLSYASDRLIKTLIYTTISNDTQKSIAVLVRGDHEINEVKLKNFCAVSDISLADEETISKITHGPKGFSGPIGLNNTEIIADQSVKGLTNFVIGANKKDYHYKNANFNRDFKVDKFGDLRVITQKDMCPRCRGQIRFSRGIEVGHIFKLGKKYSNAMKAVFLNEHGHEKEMIMGCYGIGVGRTMAAAVEQNYDSHGIIWPLPIAPFEALVLPLNIDKKKVVEVGKWIYKQLLINGIETIFDDRNESPGIKFKDADLLGIPIRITIGIKSLDKGLVELKWRDSKENIPVKPEDVPPRVKEMISHRMREIEAS
ncbi:MAG: proline--tRNA ligase [bacterium]